MTTFSAHLRYVLAAIIFGSFIAGCSEHGSSTQSQVDPSVQQSASAPSASNNLDEIFNMAVQGEIIDVPAQLLNKGRVLTDDERKLIFKLREEGGRQDDVLRFKLSAIQLDPEPTPSEEIDKVLDNLLKLTINMHALSAAVRTQRKPITAWGPLLNGLPGSELDAAVTNLARRSALKPGCELINLSDEGMPPVFLYEYNMAKVEAGEPCGEIFGMFDENNWQQQIERVARLKKYVGNEKYPVVHFGLVNKFAQDCGRPEHSQLANFLGVCAWHAKPLESKALERSLALEKSKFKFFSVDIKEDTTQAQIKQKILDLARDKVGGSAGDALAELNQYGFGHPRGYWINKENTKLVIPLQSYDQSSNLAQANRLLLIVTKTDSRYIVGPRQYGQYDDGEIEAISDKDHDGNIEVWISAEWGECDCEDCKPGVDCAIATHFMAEQFGNDLGQFTQGIAKHDESQEQLNDPRYCPVVASGNAIPKCAKIVTGDKENEELHHLLDELQKQGVGRPPQSVPTPALTESEFREDEREFRTMDFQERMARKKSEQAAALTKLWNKVEQDCGGKLAHIPAIGMTDEYFRSCTYHARFGGIVQVVVSQSGSMPLRLYVFNKLSHPNRVYSVNGVVTAIKQ